jgi:hypothetical protein
MSSRDDISAAAGDLGWAAISTQGRVDIYRSEPYSIMVEFQRDNAVCQASLFADAPEVRQNLQPRVLKAVTKFDTNKYRRIRSWLYDYQSRLASQ